MKKILRILCLFLILTAPGACCHYGHCAEAGFRVLASTFPIYLFTANVCSGLKNVKVEVLAPPAAGCPHDYSLTPLDLRKLSQADVFIVNGAGLEEFLGRAMQSVDRMPQMVDAGAGVATTELGAEHKGEANSHIFGAPDKAIPMVLNIARGLSALDSKNAAIYAYNADIFTARLHALSQKLEKTGASAANKKIALEHGALVYLARNAGLEIALIFEGGASAAKLAAIRKEIADKKPALLAGDSQYSDRMLKTLSSETGIPFAMLDPCASGPENAPLDYYETVMEQNIRTLGQYFD